MEEEEFEIDFLGNTITRTPRDLNDMEFGDDEFEYDGIPNFS